MGQGRDETCSTDPVQCREQVDVDMIAPGAAVVSHNAEESIFLALGFMCSGSRFQAALGTGLNTTTALTLTKAIDKPEHCPWRIAKERSVLFLRHTR